MSCHLCICTIFGSMSTYDNILEERLIPNPPSDHVERIFRLSGGYHVPVHSMNAHCSKVEEETKTKSGRRRRTRLFTYPALLTFTNVSGFTCLTYPATLSSTIHTWRSASCHCCSPDHWSVRRYFSVPGPPTLISNCPEYNNTYRAVSRIRFVVAKDDGRTSYCSSRGGRRCFTDFISSVRPT